MEHTIFLSQLIGAFSLVMGLSMAVKRKMMMEIFHEVFATRALSYIMGVVMLLIGLLLVLTHNIWQGGPETMVITIVGWLVLLESLSYLFFSRSFLRKYVRWLQDKAVYFAIAFAYLALGAYLTGVGFGWF